MLIITIMIVNVNVHALIILWECKPVTFWLKDNCYLICFCVVFLTLYLKLVVINVLNMQCWWNLYQDGNGSSVPNGPQFSDVYFED